MSLDGVRKYYGVQRGLIDQRLLALEAGGGGAEAGACADDESLALEATSAAHPRQLTDATPADSPGAAERLNMVAGCDTWAVPANGDEGAQVSTESDRPRRAQRSKRKLARPKANEEAQPESG